jgi:aspartate ammonia-lyase
MPLIAYALLESLSVLSNASYLLREHCISGIAANEENCKRNVENSTATATALIPKIGYKNASKIVETSQKQHISIKEAAIKSTLISEKEFEELITPEAVCKLGH